MRELAQIIRDRHSERASFDPGRPPSAADVRAILEAARWAPTAHNLQNFEVVVVDDADQLERLGAVPVTVSAAFVHENLATLSFTEEELVRRGTGVLATTFPPAWSSPTAATSVAFEPRMLENTLDGAPVILVVTYDPRRRAPASEGDILGTMSLGCVLQNMWLTAEARDISLEVMSVFASEGVEAEVREILSIPEPLRIAFACRLGHPVDPRPRYVRVRRRLDDFIHHNVYGAHRPLLSGNGKARVAVT